MPDRSSAALPSRRRRTEIAPTVVFEHPGEAVSLGCPNCEHIDSLQFIVSAKHYHSFTAREINEGRIQWPETTITDYDVAEPDLADERKPMGVRCTFCRWSLIAPDAVTKLIKSAVGA